MPLQTNWVISDTFLTADVASCGCRPVSLEGLLDIKAKHNAAKLVVGNTEVGIELKFKHAGYPILVGTTHVPELNTIEVSRACACELRMPAVACVMSCRGPGEHARWRPYDRLIGCHAA